MVRRFIDKRKLVSIGILSLLVFSLGLLLGFLIDNERVRWVVQQNSAQEIDYESLQLQQLYISGLEETPSNCAVFRKALEGSISALGKTLDLLLTYQKSSQINQNEYDQLSRKYVLDNLRFWIFAQQTKKMCNSSFLTVLYFYSDKQCKVCPDQGVLLTYYKKKLGDQLLVFPINTDLENDEALIGILKSKYNITQYPTLVIDEEVLAGFADKETLGTAICKHFTNSTCPAS